MFGSRCERFGRKTFFAIVPGIYCHGEKWRLKTTTEMTFLMTNATAFSLENQTNRAIKS